MSCNIKQKIFLSVINEQSVIGNIYIRIKNNKKFKVAWMST